MLNDRHKTVSGDEPLVFGKSTDLGARIQAAAKIAKDNAALVDAEARFPREAFAEIRRQRLLGLMIPTSLGGESAALSSIVDTCYALGQACSSTALIYAMHQVKVACVMRHYAGNAAIAKILRSVAADQLLLASSTTEGQAGGNVRSSEAAIEMADGKISLERKATVISYATSADGLVTTARRSADAGGSDQVLLVLLKADYVLERLNGWDTLGMRGTQSEGFTLRVKASAEQILPDRYELIHPQTMVPFAHLLWSSVWAGIAAAATGTAQAFCRQAARRSGGQLPPGAVQLTQATAQLNSLLALISVALRRYEAIMGDENAVGSADFQSMITLLKVQSSELAAAIVLTSMRICGLSGYRNDGDSSIGRFLRDVLSAPIMINNERILSNLTASSLIKPLPVRISG